MQTSSGVTSTVSLRTADGLTLQALHIPVRPRSAGATKAQIPGRLVIVLVPGFSQWAQKPGVARAGAVLAEFGDVVQVDLRGHGRSEGYTTLADREVLDVDAAVAYARSLYPVGPDTCAAEVVTIGFSMGGATVLRHAALVGETTHGFPVSSSPDAVVCVSTGTTWYIRDTKPMRRLHWLVLTRTGRRVARRVFQVRIDPAGWGSHEPLTPLQAAGMLRLPLLIVQGDRDAYLKVEHGYALHAAAASSELWMERGFGHAEEAADPALLRRIGAALPALLARGAATRDAG